MAGGCIDILGSHTGTLYIGVTSNLCLRVMQHKEGTLEGFTAAYDCKRLLYFEGYQDMRTAIAREKQCMKRGTRDHQVRTATRSCSRASVVEKLRAAWAR
jgi:putative endonuclease